MVGGMGDGFTFILHRDESTALFLGRSSQEITQRKQKYKTFHREKDTGLPGSPQQLPSPFPGSSNCLHAVPNHPHPSFSTFLLSFPIPFFLLFPPFLFFFPFPPLKSKRSDGKEPGRFRQTPSDKRNRDGLEEGMSRGYTFGIHAGMAWMWGRKQSLDWVNLQEPLAVALHQ